MSSELYVNLFSSFISSGLSTILTNPIEVVRINLQVNKNYSIGKMISHIYKNNGISGFGKGVNVSLLTIPPFWTVYFSSYEYLKHNHGVIYSSYISSCLASSITAPLWFIRQKKITTKDFNLVEFTKNNSIRVFFNSLIPTYFINLKFILNMTIYENLKNEGNKTNVINLMYASIISRGGSTIIMYPLDTYRAMMREYNYMTTLQLFRYINSHGLQRYYHGLKLYLIKGVPDQVILFVSYEMFKKYFKDTLFKDTK